MQPAPNDEHEAIFPYLTLDDWPHHIDTRNWLSTGVVILDGVEFTTHKGLCIWEDDRNPRGPSIEATPTSPSILRFYKSTMNYDTNISTAFVYFQDLRLVVLGNFLVNGKKIDRGVVASNWTTRATSCSAKISP